MLAIFAQLDDGTPVVRVLPTTHTPRASADDTIEIPPASKRRPGLDDERSWTDGKQPLCLAGSGYAAARQRQRLLRAFAAGALRRSQAPVRQVGAIAAASGDAKKRIAASNYFQIGDIHGRRRRADFFKQAFS